MSKLPSGWEQIPTDELNKRMLVQVTKDTVMPVFQMHKLPKSYVGWLAGLTIGAGVFAAGVIVHEVRKNAVINDISEANKELVETNRKLAKKVELIEHDTIMIRRELDKNVEPGVIETNAKLDTLIELFSGVDIKMEDDEDDGESD